MPYASFELTGNPLVPSIVHIGDRSTPVWLQNRWENGPYTRYVRANGCGHCCTAMACQLFGIQIDPHQEYEYCRSLWGIPKELPDDKGQDHFMSLAGISKVLSSFQIPVQCYGVKETGPQAATDRILLALSEHKFVIFASDPDDYPDNPFSKGYHWVMAVGYTPDGQILIANSSEKAAQQGVQFVTREQIERALFRESSVNMDLTWGELERLYEGCGYAVIG